MIELIVQNRNSIEEICRRFRIKKLEAFGSAVEGAWNPDSSDLDLIVEFESLEPGQLFDSFFGAKEDLQNLFRRKVDLIMTRAIRNRFLLDSVNRSRQVIYAA